MFEDFMTADQAAEYINRSKSLICKLCVRGELTGAKRIGKKMWLIPKSSIENYTPGPQGFAAVKARRDAARQAELDELNAEIRRAAGQKESARP